MMEGVARRAIELIGSAGEKHVEFPASILTGLQSSSGASVRSLSELDRFIHGLFAFDLPKNFFIQMAVAGACIATLVIIGLATIYSRVTQRAFWIFKATRRSEGIYLIPNALNTFLLFEGVFAALWLAFIIIQFQGYWRHEDEMQKHIATFNLIIWWPLWIGAFMAGWGSFYTAPGALDKGPLRSNGLGRFLPRPLVINIFCIGTPLILIISLIPLIVLTQHHLNVAFSAYKIFRSQIASAIASAGSGPIAASPEQSLQFLSMANNIWDMQVKTGYYMAIGYAIWPVWAAIFLIFYIPAGGYLVYLVLGQLRRQKSLLIELREKYIEEEAIERRKRELAREDGLGPGYKDYRKSNTGGTVAMRQIISLGEQSAPRDPTSSLLFQPLTSSQERATTIAGPETAPSPPVTPSTVVQGRTGISHNHQSESNEQKRSNGSSEGEDGQDVFFPAMKPEMQKRAATKRLSSVGGTPYTRYKYLRRCFINLTVLYGAIVLGAALYLGVSASLARYLYKSYQKGPEDLAHIVYYTCVIAAWGAVVFGSACIAAIMARLIDPANTPNSGSKNGSDEKGAGGQGGFARRAVTANSPFTIRKKLSHSSASPLQEKTRTLPAVPESVGATVDELMTGVSIPAPVHHTRSIGGSSSRYPRRMSSLDDGRLPIPLPMQNRALKFDMHPREGEGLVLEPSAASSFAELGGEESNLWPANPSRTPTSSRFKQIKRKNNLKSIYTTATLQSDFPSSAVGSSNNSSQRSLPSRRKYSLTEPTAAPPPPPAKPLAPARTPPLSPQYIAMINDGTISRREEGLHDLILDDEVAPTPPKKTGYVRSHGDWHLDPSSSSVQHPLMNMTETNLSAPTSMPDPHMALFSGLKFGAIPVQGADVSATQSDESDIETPMGNKSFSAHRQTQRNSKQDTPAPVKIHTNSSPSTVKTSPSVAVTPIMTRTSGLISGVSPFASPTIGLPPTPTSATAFTIPASDDSSSNGYQQIYTDRQKVPTQSGTWTPLAQGWFRIPDVQSNSLRITAQPESDSLNELDNVGKGELEMNTFASPRRPSLPLPEISAANSSQQSGLYGRRRSEAPIPGDRMSGLFF